MTSSQHSENYVAAAIAGEIAKVAGAPNGNRNIALFRASSALASLNCAEARIIAALTPAADQSAVAMSANDP
jgi:hypothetical protein